MGTCISRRSKSRQQLLAAEERYDDALAAFAEQERQLLTMREKLRLGELDIDHISAQSQTHCDRIERLESANATLTENNLHLEAELNQFARDARQYQGIADGMMSERDTALIRLQDLREHTKSLAQDYGKRLQEIRGLMEHDHESTRALFAYFRDCIHEQEVQTQAKDRALLSLQESLARATRSQEEPPAPPAQDLPHMSCEADEDLPTPRQSEFRDAETRCSPLVGGILPPRPRNRATTGCLDTALSLGRRPRKDSAVDLSDPYEGDEEWSPRTDTVFRFSELRDSELSL